LANRSLIELAKKYFEIKEAKKGVVFKSNLTLEETKEVKDLKPIPKDFLPAEGNILLTTFYKMTGVAAENITKPIYDYVILEEASQCFLGTIAAAKLLGKKIILVGDPLQLPPIVNQENPSNISQDIDLMQESFTFYASTIDCPKFRLTTTYRFSENACFQTNTFYENSLKSKSDIQKGDSILSGLPSFYNKEGGCSLHYYESTNLKGLYDLLYNQINSLLQVNPKFEIAILSSTKKGVKLSPRPTAQKRRLSALPTHKANASKHSMVLQSVFNCHIFCGYAPQAFGTLPVPLCSTAKEPSQHTA
jgi:DNA replication ATP-dependent helicase Dna2